MRKQEITRKNTHDCLIANVLIDMEYVPEFIF